MDSQSTQTIKLPILQPGEYDLSIKERIAQKDEAEIQLNSEEFDFMAVAGTYDEIEKVTANCNLQDNLQQASTSGTQSDKAPVYDSNGSVKVTYEILNESSLCQLDIDFGPVYELTTQSERRFDTPYPYQLKKILEYFILGAHTKQPRYAVLSSNTPYRPVIILNTIDHLGKFDGKADEGFFVGGYSTNSKAFRVFNSRTRIVEENLHVQFSENTSNIVGSGPTWLFDIDALTNSMNYKPVVTRNQSNGNTGTKACDNAGKARMETIPGKDYILLPMWPADPLFSQNSKDSLNAGFKSSGEEEKKDAEDPGKDSEISSTEEPRINQEKDASVNNTNNINTISLTVNDTSIYGCADDPNIPELEDIIYSDDDEDVGAEADMNNLDAFMLVILIPTTRIHEDYPFSKEQPIKTFKTVCLLAFYHKKNPRRNKKDERGIVIKNKARLVAQGYTQEEGIYYDKVFAPVTRIEAIRLFLAYASFKDFVVYQMDVKSVFLYGKIEEEVSVCQPPRFEDPDFADRVYKVEKALYGLHQAPRACPDYENGKATEKVKSVNGEVQLQALVDGKKVIITETSEKTEKGTEIPQSSGPTEHMADEAADEENVPTQSNNPPLSRVNTLRSREDRLKLKELMDLCTKLSNRVLNLDTTKTTQAKETASLKKRVKKLERKKKSKTPGMKRLFKVVRSAQVVSSEDKGLGDQEDASKQGRKITDIDQDAEVTLVYETQGRYDDAQMFDTDVFNGEEVFIAKKSEKVVEEVVSNAEVSAAATIATEEITLAQALA
ncbi:putative ribonuclease H-like domain-containing protein [Tanacetum coccineum]